jgi:regulator of protease activity HflC (stomatin/prohibitin superfamily)
MAIDIPEQVCITRDNVQVGVDGVLYLKVLDPERASYGISNYVFAIAQLAQTTLRSEIGKIDLDRTFEERANDQPTSSASSTRRRSRGASRCCATRSRTSTRRSDVLNAMEKQMRAEREKRADILTSPKASATRRSTAPRARSSR